MSLVSEALRKARREATQRKRPSRLPAALPEPPGGVRGTRFGAGLALGAFIALAAALLGAGATWWLVTTLRGGGGGNEDVPSPIVVRVEEAGAPVATPAASVGSARSGGFPLVPTPLPASTMNAGQGASESPATSAGDATSTPPPPPRTATPRVDGGAIPAPRATATGGDRVFVLEADLGYVRLSLGFVVARPTDPFAEINGQEVHVGTELEGFVVEEITARGVRLRDSRGPLDLRLR